MEKKKINKSKMKLKAAAEWDREGKRMEENEANNKAKTRQKQGKCSKQWTFENRALKRSPTNPKLYTRNMARVTGVAIVS